MSEDLTQTLPTSDSEKLTLILTTVQSLTVRADNIDSRLDRVEQTVHDTRPILQKVVTDIAQLQQGQRGLQEGQRRLQEGQLRLEEGQEVLRSEVHAMRRDVNHRFLVLSGTTNADIRDLKERVTRLEENSNPPNSQT